MEYCRRSIVTEFRIVKSYPELTKLQLIIYLNDLMENIPGGEYFYSTNKLQRTTGYSVDFFFYNQDDMMMAKLSM